MAFWACVQIARNHERMALHCLEHVAGFEIYSPRIKAPRASRNQASRPLFPGYVFVLIVLQWHSASRAPGVLRLVTDGGVPARVPDDVIAELRGREGRNGLIKLPEPPGLRAGARVRVTRGLFVGLEGLVAGMSGTQRIEILLGLLGRARVVLPIADVEAV
jgi:transcriptional antiterminator RfaH